MRGLVALLIVLLSGLSLGVAAKPDDFRDYVIWHMPPGDSQVPLVVMIEGTGGTRANATSSWGTMLRDRGIAVAQVRSAAARGRQDWSGASCDLQYSGDARDVVELARSLHPRIDLSRVALMGFSRGGTEVLNSARSFRGATAPTAVFAFYPGCAGWCETDYAKDGATAVHILYGDSDEWGKYRDSYGKCRRLAGGKIVFHGLPGAHHGFDNRSTGTFRAGGEAFRYEPNAQATETARGIILQTLTPAWTLPN